MAQSLVLLLGAQIPPPPIFYSFENKGGGCFWLVFMLILGYICPAGLRKWVKIGSPSRGVRKDVKIGPQGL